ncbi:hypothetical protein ACF0H5_020761 [Mactra antiquata]
MSKNTSDRNIPTTSRHFNVPDSRDIYPNCTRRNLNDKKSDKTSESDAELQEAEDLLNDIDEYYASISKPFPIVNKSDKVSVKDESESKNFDVSTVSSNLQNDVFPKLHLNHCLQQADCKTFVELEKHLVPDLSKQIVNTTEESESQHVNEIDSTLENKKYNKEVVDLTDVLQDAKYIKSPSIEYIFDKPNELLNEERRPECVIASAPTIETITCRKVSVGILPGRLPGVVPRYREIEYSFNSVTVIDSFPVSTDSKKETKTKGGLKKLLCGCFCNEQTEIEAVLNSATKKKNAESQVRHDVEGVLDHDDSNDDNDDDYKEIDNVYIDINDDNTVDDNDNGFVDILFDDDDIDVHINGRNTRADDFLHFDGNIEIKETKFRKVWRRVRRCFR